MTEQTMRPRPMLQLLPLAAVLLTSTSCVMRHALCERDRSGRGT